MSLKFLFKKGFHPARLDIQERIWKKEQEKDAEQKRIAELKQRIEEEKGIEELRRLQEIAGGKNAGSSGLDWMYAGPQAQRKEQEEDEAEALLTGKRVIGTTSAGKASAAPGDFDLMSQSAKLNSITQGRAALQAGGSAVAAPAAREAPILSHKEEARIRAEDPLLAMREQEEAMASRSAIREALLADPVLKERMRRLQEQEGKAVVDKGGRSDRQGVATAAPPPAAPSQGQGAWQGRRDNRPAWLVQQENAQMEERRQHSAAGDKDRSEIASGGGQDGHRSHGLSPGREPRREPGNQGRGDRSRSRSSSRGNRHRRHRSRSREKKHRRRHHDRERSRSRHRSRSRSRHRHRHKGDDRDGKEGSSRRHRSSKGERESSASQRRSRSTEHRRHRARSPSDGRDRARSAVGGERWVDYRHVPTDREEQRGTGDRSGPTDYEGDAARGSTRVPGLHRHGSHPAQQAREVEEGEEEEGALSDEEKGRSTQARAASMRYGLTHRGEDGSERRAIRASSDRPLGPGEAAIAAAKERAAAALGRLKDAKPSEAAAAEPNRAASLAAMQAAARARVQEVQAQMAAKEAERAQVPQAGPGQAAPAFIARAASDAMGKVIEARYGSK